MMSTTGLLCLVAALVVSTDSCTECIKCLNTNGIKCDCEQTVQCPNGCATFSEYSIVQNRAVPSIKMDCAPDGLTEPVTFGFNDAGQLKAQVHIAPCTGDYCNKNLPFHYDPKDLGPPNGLYCESCFLENSKVKECNSCDRVACRGGQTQCLSVSTTFQRGNGVIADYVVKGCATEYICLVKYGIIPEVKDERNHCVSDLDCIVKFLFLPSTKILDERTFKCTKATTSARDCSGCKGKNFYY